MDIRGIPLYFAIWKITDDCDFSCSPCVHRPFGQRRGTLLTADALRVIDSLKTAEVPVLSLTGGEPLLRDDVSEIVAHATKQSIRTEIRTNGFRLDDATIARLRISGLHEVVLGIYGPTPAMHDAVTGVPGSFQRTIAAAQRVKGVGGIQCNAEITCYAETYQALRDTLDLLVKLGFDHARAYAPPPGCYERPAGASRFTLLSKEQNRDFLETLVAERRRHRKGFLNLPSTLYHLIDTPLLERIRSRGDIRSGRIFAGCSCAISTVYLGTGGEVTLCNFLPQIVIGNALEEPLDSIWRSRAEPAGRFIRREYEGRCGDCEFKFICGGCRARARQLAGNAWAADPYCWRGETSREGSQEKATGEA